MSTDSTVPRPALMLGLAGLLPGLAMFAVMLVLPDWRDAAARIGLGYGAVIASFVGGAWWGLVAARPEVAARGRLLALSVVPSLLAWPALLLPPAAGLVLLAMVFASLLPTDARLHREGIAPGWWMGLRRPLSLGMALLHAAAAALLMLSAGRMPG